MCLIYFLERHVLFSLLFLKAKYLFFFYSIIFSWRARDLEKIPEKLESDSISSVLSFDRECESIMISLSLNYSYFSSIGIMMLNSTKSFKKGTSCMSSRSCFLPSNFLTSRKLSGCRNPVRL